MNDLIGKIRRGLRKPPQVIASRLLAMTRREVERIRLPNRLKLSQKKLLKELRASSLDVLWHRLTSRPFAVSIAPFTEIEFETFCGAKERQELFNRAENALDHRVDLLGSGPIQLGSEIDWHTDFKVGLRWPPGHFTDIEYNNPERPSDVKIPWELSRLQWLMPAGQAFLLTRDDRYALGIREVLEQWIVANPCGGSVNWSCTMEAAMRIFTWTWFFHVCHNAPSWQDAGFRFRFLKALFLHVEFTDRHIERSDVNGNHYTADAAALVVGGLFFGEGKEPQKWQSEGWRILSEEMPRQVFPDGVDFEASVPYHRLVAELFLFPAMHRTAQGLPVHSSYRERLGRMARFTNAYSRNDGSVPLWGDADDARTLPFGCQHINDHRYLPTLIGIYLDDLSLCNEKNAGQAEVLWAFGLDAARRWMKFESQPQTQTSQAFIDGGFFVMRNSRDHVFVDCGPLGLGGRGGHGHNDITSFEAVLDGVHLVSDCGAYLYTANFKERNNFRSTKYHNVVRIDKEEINRFQRPDYLWTLHNDACHLVKEVVFKADSDLLRIGHTGYERLNDPVRVHRTFVLDHGAHSLNVSDEFEGMGEHLVEASLHLAPGVSAALCEDVLCLQVANRFFSIVWSATNDWEILIEDSRVSTSYGLFITTKKIVWRRLGALRSLDILIAPSERLSG